MFSVDELSYIAMERCKTSRCAVQTMGDLAVEHGFYGAGDYSEGSSESLLVKPRLHAPPAQTIARKTRTIIFPSGTRW